MDVEDTASNPANQSPENDKADGLFSTPANISPRSDEIAASASTPAKESPEDDKIAAPTSIPVKKPPVNDSIKLPPSLAAKNDVPIKSPLPRLQTPSEATPLTGEEAPTIPPHLRNIVFPSADPGSVVSGGGIRYNHFVFFDDLTSLCLCMCL